MGEVISITRARSVNHPTLGSTPKYVNDYLKGQPSISTEQYDRMSKNSTDEFERLMREFNESNKAMDRKIIYTIICSILLVTGYLMIRGYLR